MSRRFVLPGESLGPVGSRPVEGNVYNRSGLLHSSVMGTVESIVPSDGSASSIDVRHPGSSIPAVGAIVIAQVQRISHQQAECCIVCLEGRSIPEGLKGVISLSNIYQSKAIEPKIYECFHPGDFVRAKVISTSDTKQLMLSTAQKDLGVIRVPEAGEELVPISWKFFLGAKSGTVLTRKVAYPSVTVKEPRTGSDAMAID